jgi:phosphatidylserine synthase
MSRAPFREGIAVRHAVSTFPNQLTAARLLLIVVMWVLTWLRLPFYVAIGILAALITDVLDGVIARRLNQASEFGSKFDSLVDNILLPSSLVWLWFAGRDIYRPSMAHGHGCRSLCCCAAARPTEVQMLCQPAFVLEQSGFHPDVRVRPSRTDGRTL